MQRVEPNFLLRERGIYRLPDAREFIIVRSGDGGGYLLFNIRKWMSLDVADYRAHNDGRLLSRGTVTRWRVADLVDTGRTAP